MSWTLILGILVFIAICLITINYLRRTSLRSALENDTSEKLFQDWNCDVPLGK